MTVEGRLAAFAAGLEWEALPGSIRDRVGDIALDAIASALAGSCASGLEPIEGLADQLGSGSSCTVIGDGRASLLGATLRNAHQTTAVTVCDVYRPALCHVTPEVVAPALAVAEERQIHGRELLAAIAVGLETTVRIGRGLDYPRFRERGWHAPGVIGPFGGAVAVGRLLRLDQSRMLDALGLAGSQAAGTFAALGTPTVKFHQSRGAVSALIAALLAERGFRASDEILTAEDGGLLATYSGGGDGEAIVSDLGGDWELEQISLRGWPLASSLQTVVACAQELRNRHQLSPDDVTMLTVSLPETGYALSGQRGWDDPLTAQQSARYVAGVVLTDGECWLAQFSERRIADEHLTGFLAERTDARREDAIPPSGAMITVNTRDGMTLTVQRDIPPGDPRDPLSSADVRAKLSKAAGSAGIGDRCDEIITAFDALSSAPSPRLLLDALAGPQRATVKAGMNEMAP